MKWSNLLGSWVANSGSANGGAKVREEGRVGKGLRRDPSPRGMGVMGCRWVCGCDPLWAPTLGWKNHPASNYYGMRRESMEKREKKTPLY